MSTAHALLASRRFGAVFACITLSAFNDNFFKNALVILLTYHLAAGLDMPIEVLISIASAFFILPFFLFSGLAGELADAMPKHRLVRILKLTEALLMVAAGIALPFEMPWVLLTILFFIGMQAAFFGPTKYAILPQLLTREELLLGNGLVEGGTFLSILLGTLVGGVLILQPNGTLIVGVLITLIGFLGVYAAWKVPMTAIANPGMKVSFNVFRSTWRMVRHAMENPQLRGPILGISWFWVVGAIYLTQLPVFTKQVLGGNEMVVTLFNGVFTVGVALGSILCPYIIERYRLRHLSAFALWGVCLFALDLCWMGYHMPRPTADALIGMMEYLTSSFNHIRIAADLALMAFCAGLFIVPLYTQLQTQSEAYERARTIASNNVVNAFCIATASLVASVMFAHQVDVVQVLLLFAALNLPVIALLHHIARKKKH